MMTERRLSEALRRWREQSQRTRYTLAPRNTDPRRDLANQVQAIAAERLQALGFHVVKQSHKAHFDIMADGLRVEVKASTWNGRQYQANLRDNDADVLLFGCMDGRLHWFVVPFEVVRGRRVVKISSHNPHDYTGRLTPFYDAWDSLPDLAKSARNPYQPELV